MFIHVLELVLFKVKMMSCDIVGDCCLTPNKQLFFIMTRTQVTFQRDNDDVRFVLDQHT
jgi:hypothetical protein